MIVISIVVGAGAGLTIVVLLWQIAKVVFIFLLIRWLFRKLRGH